MIMQSNLLLLLCRLLVREVELMIVVVVLPFEEFDESILLDIVMVPDHLELIIKEQ